MSTQRRAIQQLLLSRLSGDITVHVDTWQGYYDLEDDHEPPWGDPIMVTVDGDTSSLDTTVAICDAESGPTSDLVDYLLAQLFGE